MTTGTAVTWLGAPTINVKGPTHLWSFLFLWWKWPHCSWHQRRKWLLGGPKSSRKERKTGWKRRVRKKQDFKAGVSPRICFLFLSRGTSHGTSGNVAGLPGTKKGGSYLWRSAGMSSKCRVNVLWFKLKIYMFPKRHQRTWQFGNALGNKEILTHESD